METLVVLAIIAATIAIVGDTTRRRREKREDAIASTTSLDAQVMLYAGRGYRIIYRDALTAQMMRPRRFSFWWALCWLLCFGVGIIIYLIWFAAKKDEVVYFSWPAPTYTYEDEAYIEEYIPPALPPGMPSPIKARKTYGVSDGR